MMHKEVAVFKRKRFTGVIVISHTFIWAVWAFIKMDAITPFITTFSSTDGRGCYVGFLFAILWSTFWYWLPFEERKE